MDVLKTKNLTKYYGKNRGIIDVNIDVHEGEIFGFIGPNGAGKSTFIRTILNFIYPTSGSGTIFGKDIEKDSKLIKSLVGYVPSEVKYYGKVRVRDILEYANSFKKSSYNREINSLIDELDIDEKKLMAELSLGNKKKVAIAQALLGDPQLLILDEPASGLDPLMQKKLFSILTNFREQGKTVFLSSHNLVEVENLCDRVAIIKEGRIVDIVDLKSKIESFGRVIELKGDMPEAFIEKMAEEVLAKDHNYYRFIYKGNIDDFVKEVSKYNIEDLGIRKENLEDTFIKYYERKEDLR